ncbi:MAG: serine hydrolase domain-containing protein, partial [Thermomicrobiales bacterium]
MTNRLASLSNALAATVVSAVVGNGALSWDSRLAEIDPGFASHDAWPTQEATLADLFSHRSDLHEHAGDRLEDLGFGQDEVTRRLRFLTPEYRFHGGYAYTNFGLSAAAYAAARAAGMSWADLSASRVCEPLEMTRTSLRFAVYIAGPQQAGPPGWARRNVGHPPHPTQTRRPTTPRRRQPNPSR